MFTRPGMYTDDALKQDVDLPLGVTTSFYMPAGPQPGQDTETPCSVLGQGSPYGCCFTTVQLAAACNAKRKGFAHFDTNLTGNVTISVGDFDVDVTFAQDRVTAVYDQALVASDGGILGLIKCSDISWD